jgi:anaerobic dimethyl sulfoxide reductase subunit A
MLQGAQLVILWGANISDLRFGVKLEPVLRSLKQQGVPFYVVDPRWTRSAQYFLDTPVGETASDTSHWLAIKPGTDAALMAGVLYQLLSTKSVNRTFLERYTNGFDALERWILGRDDGIAKTPVWAAEICGLPVGQIVNFARDYGNAHPAALIPGLSIQRVLGGEEAYRMAIGLQAARANIGIPGGTPGSCLWHAMPGPEIGSIGSMFSPLPQAGDDLQAPRFNQPHLVPINTWQVAVIEGRGSGWPTDIHGIYGVGNNFLLQSSDLSKSRSAFEKVDLSVCHDLFLTGTALFSDYVLPATHFLERDDVVSAGENYLYYSHKIMEPPGEARDDYDILNGLAERLGIGQHFSQGLSSAEWLDVLLKDSEIGDIDSFRATGIYDGEQHDRIGLAGFINDPAGHPLPTISGRLEFICPENLEHGFPAHPHYRPETDSGYPLMMITPHARYRVNSQNSNLPWFREKEHPLVYMHPEDAQARLLKDGMEVTISSAQGTMTLPLQISREIRPGVICALQGNWDVPDAVNHLTSTTSTLPSFGSRTHSIRVEVTPYTPEIRHG